MVDIKNCIEYNRGSIPLIISVPHGGTTKCDHIPRRTNGIHGIDKDTIKLARELIEKINNIFKSKTPSYIISKIHRAKIDFNRNSSEAFDQESDLAKRIYHFYHNKIEELILHNLETFNRSMLIDIHGFEKDKRPKGFRDVELILGTNNLESLYPISIPKRDWGKNLRGKIVKKFNNLNIAVAPGHHLRREFVLTGGYITTKYGASRIKNSQTIQIEFSDKIRLYDENLRDIVLKSLAQLLYEEFG
jgi:N-formylglutamate amidohydrolase